MLATSMGIFGIDHIGFRTPDIARLREFYAELLGAERLEGTHAPLRVGGTTLVFFEEEAAVGADELAFDADLEGFSRALEAARRLGAIEREPVEHTLWSRGFLVRDPDGRRIEVVRNDEGVYWREG
jgi:catechol-2,3-dioxygenase